MQARHRLSTFFSHVRPWEEISGLEATAEMLRPLPTGGPQETDTESCYGRGAKSNGLGKEELKT